MQKTEEIFLSGKGEHAGGTRVELGNMVFFRSANTRELPGTLIIVKIGSTDHALSIFFRNSTEVKVKIDYTNAATKISFYLPTFLESCADLILNLKEIHRLSQKSTHRLMYDFQTRNLQIGSGYGKLDALALPYEDDKLNGTNLLPEEEAAKEDVFFHLKSDKGLIEKSIQEAIKARNGKYAKELTEKIERKLTTEEVQALAGLS